MDLYHFFRANSLWAGLESGTLLVAVSGGADSVALLHLLRRLSGEKKWKLIVAHVQHQLRGRASKQDEKFVRELARRLEIGLEAVTVDVRGFAKIHRKTLEDSARILRYRSLGDLARKHGARFILTAHHADDQAETLLLHLLRGSGLQGLCGMKEQRPLNEISGRAQDRKMVLLRPLLSFGKQDILKYVQSQDLTFREDASNHSVEFTRNWLRLQLLPLIQERYPQAAQKIAQFAQIAQNHWDWSTLELQKMRKACCGSASGKTLDLKRFFRYHISLQLCFLHDLLPQASYREIREIHALLLREKFNSSFALKRLHPPG